MKKLALVLASILVGSLAQAQDYGIFGGFNTTEFESTVDWDREFGIEFGATALVPLQGDIGVRTGAGFVQKNSSNSAADLSFSYIEIPATIYFKATDTMSFFGGLNLNLNIADDCERSGGGDCNPDAETIVINLPLGARFNIQDNHNIEPVLELGVTDIADDTKIGNSLSVRYLYMFGK